MAIDDLPPKDEPRPDWNLPAIREISIRRVPFNPRQYKYFRSALGEYREALEFMVRLSAPVPVRALGPALYVGDMPVTEVEAVEPTLYRFLAFDVQRFQPGAAITWGWAGSGRSERASTQFRFELRQ